MFRPLFLAGALLLSPALMAENLPRYISDDIYIYLHNGPGNEFRILGSINAGTQVSFTGKTSGDFSEIVDHRGREGWVRTDALSSGKSLKQQLEEAQQALEDNRAELAAVREEFKDADGTIRGLREQLAKADELVRTATADKNSAEAAREQAESEMQSLKNNERFRLWQEGGLIAALGILVGVILVYLPRPQRKRAGRWMN
ncbi:MULTISPECIES: TIGR04211 family SH3 domain-containing protein [Shewanella]|uniref:TIGR04211 family SH3 domain-containing protein n=1 Tax=Shewanella TaxID=22 RepID=UPI001C65707E|nr:MULTISPECIES: TIGR04211 family SH3 domain-containing protein [Shewanella]QYJ74465.1 TIGR04211 family SH3 domain-containing protein [Shewanella sp. FJAT-52076]QYK04337.1 TIGR04211 family SH3 domain-containing protein [Shewanella zhangzhouensis]